MGAFLYFEISSLPYIDKKLNKISCSSAIIILISICMKLFSFAVMENIWNTITDLIIIILNIVFVVEVIFRMILAKRRDIYKIVSSNL